MIARIQMPLGSAMLIARGREYAARHRSEVLHVFVGGTTEAPCSMHNGDIGLLCFGVVDTVVYTFAGGREIITVLCPEHGRNLARQISSGPKTEVTVWPDV